MKQRSWLCILLAALVALSPIATAAAAPIDLEKFRSAIHAQFDLKERVFAKNNPDFIVDDFYSEDVFSTDILSNPINWQALDRPGQPARTDLDSLVVDVKYDGPADAAE